MPYPTIFCCVIGIFLIACALLNRLRHEHIKASYWFPIPNTHGIVPAIIGIVLILIGLAYMSGHYLH